MATFDKKLLDHLKGLTQDNSKIKQLIEDKQHALNDIDNSQFTYQKLEPSPSGMPRIDKVHKSKVISEEKIKEAKECVKETYDEKIEQSVHEHFEEQGYKTELEEVKELEQDDLVTLLEKDSDAVLEKQQELDKENIDLEQGLKMDEEESKTFFENHSTFDDFQENSKDMDIQRNPSPSDDFE